jgi:hypothetical protein
MTDQTPSPARTDRLVIEVDRDGWTNGLQVQIAQLNADDTGDGYRLAGPKYNGSSKNLLRAELDQHDADRIRACLDAVFPTQQAPEVDRLTVAYRASSDREHDLINERDKLRERVAELERRPSRAAVLREAADEADRAGASYAARGEADRADGAFAVMEKLLHTARAADATPCDPTDEGGETATEWGVRYESEPNVITPVADREWAEKSLAHARRYNVPAELVTRCAWYGDWQPVGAEDGGDDQ